MQLFHYEHDYKTQAARQIFFTTLNKYGQILNFTTHANSKLQHKRYLTRPMDVSQTSNFLLQKQETVEVRTSWLSVVTTRGNETKTGRGCVPFTRFHAKQDCCAVNSPMTKLRNIMKHPLHTTETNYTNLLLYSPLTCGTNLCPETDYPEVQVSQENGSAIKEVTAALHIKLHSPFTINLQF